MPLQKFNMGLYNELSTLSKRSSPSTEAPSAHKTPNDKTILSKTKRKNRSEKEEQSHKQVVVSRNHDTTTPRHHGIVVPRYHDTIIEIVRKAVKEIGKEAATHRFAVEEKKAVASIIYAYGAQDVKTSENEIARIAINFIVQDYRENGENSILDKVLRALNK